MDDSDILDAIQDHDTDTLEAWVSDMDDATLLLWLNNVWDFHGILTEHAMRRKGMA
jgi:hypothetical protein